MSAALAVFLLAVVVPVFFGKTRSAPAWLMLQALALAAIGFAQHAQVSTHGIAALAEVVLVRALLAPWLLRRAIRRHGGPNLDLMPSNLFAWAVAIALVVLAFEFGAPAADDRHALTLGAVAATVAVSLLLLATSASAPTQLVAVLYMENALGLFETLLPEPWPLPVHVALGLIYLGTVAVGSWLIGAPELAPDPAEPAAPQGETP
jgi:hydrogenase-4 membrane subunit HyfE